MSKGRELGDYLADILTAITEVEQFIAERNSEDSIRNV